MLAQHSQALVRRRSVAACGAHLSAAVVGAEQGVMDADVALSRASASVHLAHQQLSHAGE
jgi:hypothetical protein